MSKIDITQEINSYPTIQRKIQSVASHINSGRSVIWLIQSESTIDNIHSILEDKLLNLGLSNLKEFKAEEIDCSPFEFFSKNYFNVDNIYNYYEYFNNNTALTQLFYIKNFDEIDANLQDEWQDFIEGWSKSSNLFENEEIKVPPLLIYTKKTKILSRIDYNQNIKIQWYWGWLSQAEITISLKYLLNYKSLKQFEKLWIEAVLPAISGPNIELLNYLLENYKPNQNFEDLKLLIKESVSHDKIKRLIKQKDKSFVYKIDLNKIPFPSPDVYDLWENGLIDVLDYNSVFIHSAVLINYDEDMIKHRIWQGQSKMLLPMIDSVRHQLCKILYLRCGEEWKDHCKLELDRERDKYENINSNSSITTHIKGIQNFMRKTTYKFNTFKEINSCLDIIRESRNSLAHYCELEKKVFETTISKIYKLDGYIENL